MSQCANNAIKYGEMRTIDDRAEDVKSAIGRVRERINSHSSQYSGSAVATCYQLVFPVLRVLGWDPDNPATTHFLSDAPDGRVRLALRRDDGAAAILDVKNLGPNMDLPPPAKIDDLLIASDVADASVVAYTDGDEWVVYRKDEGWERRAKRLLESENFELGSWLNRWLWELGDGKKPRPRKPSGEWQPLSEATPKDRKPVRVRFRDGVEVSVSTLGGAYAAMGKYLVRTGILTNSHVPLGVTNSHNIVFSSTPEHLHGRRFTMPVDVGRGIWMETFIATRNFVKFSLRVFAKLDADPSGFEFKFGPDVVQDIVPAARSTAQTRDGRGFSVAELDKDDIVGTKPAAVTFLGGSEQRVTKWSDVFRLVASELVRLNLVATQHMPIALPNARNRVIANLSPFHPDGRRFRTPFGPVAGIHFEVSGPVAQVINWLLHLLDLAQVPQDFVKVRLRTSVNLPTVHLRDSEPSEIT